MRIFPAVDILGGLCVQLVQGKRESATAFGDPLGCATRWLDQGADALHVVNLDGAFGSSAKNADLIMNLIKKTGVEIELGGGIRSLEDAAHWLNTGVSRIIMSTLATRSPESVRILADEYGSERVMAGVDAKGGEIAVHGWQETAGDYLELCAFFLLLIFWVGCVFSWFRENGKVQQPLATLSGVQPAGSIRELMLCMW